MAQPTITCYFKKEINLDWDEADNCYGQPSFDNFNESYYTPRVILEKLPDSVVEKYVNAKNSADSCTEICSRCKKKFKNMRSLLTHSYYCGKNRVNLQCAHCSYKTIRKINLTVHLWKIHAEGKINQKTEDNDYDSKFARVCKKCKATSESLCPSRCERCFNELLYQCNTCVEQFETRSRAFYHWSTRCGVKGFFCCSKCDFKSVWRSKVVRHLKYSHQCPNTSDEFKNIKWIGINQSDKSPESSSHECPKCSKIMKNSEKLKWHVLFCGAEDRVKNNDIKDQTENAKKDTQFNLPNVCSSCGKQFEHIYSLNTHTRHCMNRKYMTRINNDSDVEVVETDEDLLLKSSKSPDKRNAKIREMIVRYCSKCDEGSAIKESWGISRKVACRKCKTTLSFKCKKCLKEYSKYPSVRFHLNSICCPQDEFKCNECSYKASIPSKIREHYVSVHGTADAECKKCQRKFKSNDYLKRHIRRCGVKPKFQCDNCPFKSKLKIYLRNHIFRCHMEPDIVIDRRESVKISRQLFSRTLIHLKANCLKCKKEQRLNDRLKVCRICKTTLSCKCKTCKKNYLRIDDVNACNHVKSYLETIKYECKRCGRGSISEKSLSMHESLCGVKPSFQCKFCKFISKIKGNTTKHEKAMHPHEL